MPNYTYATLQDAQDAVLARLYNNGIQNQPSATMWTRDELTYYITEALRSWNAYTGFWRSGFSFNLVVTTNPATNWYDLTAQANSNRPFTVTDQYIANVIEYHLLEPQTSLNPSTSTPATWTGSNQFSLTDILNAITRRQNETLTTTGCTITRTLVPAAIQTNTILSDSTLDIRRVTWLPEPNNGLVPTILRQSDNWEKQSFDYTWTTTAEGTPQTWMQSSQPSPSFDVDRTPSVPGQYEVLTVDAAPTSDITSAQELAVPDDWSFVVKWGALADLLSNEASAKDAARAAYCEARWQQDCQILQDAPCLLGMQINSIPLFVDAVRNGDDFNPTWQAQYSGMPTSCYAAGLNLVGFPNPDSAYGVLAICVQNAPIPASPIDYIQIARGDYDAMIDEAQHLACFKLGGAEFAATVPLHQKFLAQASLYNAKLRVMGQFNPDMQGISQRESRRNPRMI